MSSERSESNSDSGSQPKSLRLVRKQHIERTIETAGHDLSESARLLGVTPENLRKLMIELGIGREVEAADGDGR